MHTLGKFVAGKRQANRVIFRSGKLAETLDQAKRIQHGRINSDPDPMIAGFDAA